MWGRYGYKLNTTNDSELIYHSDEPLTEFPDASMAVAELHSNGTLRWYRNGKRPLYMADGFFMSTKDIASACGTCATRALRARCDLHTGYTETKLTTIKELIPCV